MQSCLSPNYYPMMQLLLHMLLKMLELDDCLLKYMHCKCNVPPPTCFCLHLLCHSAAVMAWPVRWFRLKRNIPCLERTMSPVQSLCSDRACAVRRMAPTCYDAALRLCFLARWECASSFLRIVVTR